MSDWLANLANLIVIVTFMATAATSAGERLRRSLEQKRQTESANQASDVAVSLKRMQRFRSAAFIFNSLMLFVVLIFLAVMLSGPDKNKPATVQHVAIVGILMFNVILSIKQR